MISVVNTGEPQEWKKYEDYNIEVDPDQDDKATRIKLGSLKRPHMRAFHMSWWGFFIAFFIWFAIVPLLSEIQDDLGLTKQEIWTSPRNSWGAHSGPPSINRHSTGTSTFRSREPNIFTTSTRANSSLSPFGSSPSSSAADKLKELSELCTQRPPTTSEMNQWNILNAMIGSPTTSATDETKKNFLGMQQFSVLAWANVHPNDVDYLNNHNNYFWPKLNACKNKPDARHVVRTEMFQHLIHKHPKLITCLHDDLIETIINFRFKPVNLESDKPTLGLGPMAFVPRDRREIEMMSHQISINEQSDSPTTSDIDKTRLGRPKIPDGASGTTSTIESCALVNDFLWAPSVEILTRTTDRPQIPLLSRNDSNSQTSQSNPKSNSNDKCLSSLLTQATQRLKDSLR